MSNLQQIVTSMSKLAPHRDALEWDNVGLQVGDYRNDINRILIALDITEEIIEEAMKKNADLIITHHPLLFNGIENIHSQTSKGRTIIKAIKNDIAIYSAHTNIDIAEKGLNDLLAEKLNIINTEILSKENETELYKLAVYTPYDNVEEVKKAIFKKGAGKIGSYSNTSFSIRGEGTFLPGEDTTPHLGKKGELKEVNEIKIETVVPENKVDNVVKGILKAHPYEEVAYDIYKLPYQSQYKGLGRIGELKETINLKKYCKLIKNTLQIDKLKVRGNFQEDICKVAICSGAGADFISLAKAKGADLYITGDVKYHQAQLAEELELNLVDAGHYQTEVIFKELIGEYLKQVKKADKLEFDVIISNLNSNPWSYI
ncbi:MAG: Nif3-like dinuclear metal center hexameric protein [Halanaerobiales bacterium]